MPALDRFLELQAQGYQEQDIISMLRQEGFSTTEVNDSINQAKIKTAVSQETEQNYSATDIAGTEYPQQDYSQQYGGQQQDYSQQYDGQQQDYSGYYQNAATQSTETVTDIAEQVVSEKTQEINKKLDKIIQEKNIVERELKDLKENVKKIQETMDFLQKAIIGKVGEFGESTKMVQKDLENIHNTMSKMMNPLVDNYNELKKLNSLK